MKILSAAVCLAFLLALPQMAIGATFTAASCSQTDVTIAINDAGNGDTVLIPAGTCVWSLNLNITKAIILKGAACPVDLSDIATSGTTIIKDGNPTDGGIITWTLVANLPSRMTCIEFQDGAVGARSTNGIIRVVGGVSNVDSRTIRVDHVVFRNLDGVELFPSDAIGVVDHNSFLLTCGCIHSYVYHSNWNGYTSADGSFADTDHFGTDKFLFFETNIMEYNMGTPYAAFDAYRGARFVVRYNQFKNAWVEMHGTDSGGRERGTRAVEVYNNTFSCTVACSFVANSRSGTLLAHDNTVSGFTIPHFEMGPYRLLFPFEPFGQADGTNIWDVNVGGGPFESGTATAGSGLLTLVDNTKSWATNQWVGYELKQVTGCVHPQYCASWIVSNTATTITLHDGGSFPQLRGWTDLTLATGNSYSINKPLDIFDGPGRSGGTQLLLKNGSGVWTSSGSVATATINAHGYSNGDLIGISGVECMVGCPNGNFFNGSFIVGGVTANTFTYTMLGAPGSPSGFSAFPGSGTRVPPANNQIDDPSYEWNNTQGLTNIQITTPYPAQIRAGEAFFNDTPAPGYTPFVYPHPLVNSIPVPPDPDTTPPVPGGFGVITVSAITSSSLTLTWVKGTDAITPQASLQYEVARSNFNNIDVANNVESNGTVIGAYTADIATFGVTGLAASTTYYFNILIRDLAGNRTAYTMVSATTNAPPAPMVPSLSSISPSNGKQGQIVSVTLTGTNFTSPANINIAGTGVTVNGVTVVSATKITAGFSIAPTANISGRLVNVTVTAGTSGSVTFTVQRATGKPPRQKFSTAK